jgi:transcriptional regulator with XRE-family HTH domain
MRAAAEMSQADLAAKMKISQQAVQGLEKRGANSSRTLQRVAKATGHEMQISFVKRR